MSSSDLKAPEPKSRDPETETLANQTSSQVSDSSIEIEFVEGVPDRSKKVDGNGEESKGEKEGEEEGEEEEGECGFCLFMKAGGCRETFIAWEDCIAEAEKKGDDIVMKCSDATAALKKCMEAHADYYEPILRAEKTAEEEAMRELEKEAAASTAKDADQNAATNESDQEAASSAK